MDQKKLNELREYYDNTDTSDEIKDAELDNEIVQSPMVGITVRLPAEVLQQVRELASGEGAKTTALIRRWIEERLQIKAAVGQRISPFVGEETLSIFAFSTPASSASNEDYAHAAAGIPIHA